MRGTKPIDTAPTVAVPIMVKMTRRERFMRSPALTFEASRPSLGIQASAFKPQHSSLWHSRLGIEADLRSAHKPKPDVSQDRAGRGPLGLVSTATGKMRR